ncbi:MAG: hypothetical protein OEM25_00285 [Gammaproteobacteria bacterium]|nr:hypothetical protein [Gammaproteobacteria bacterium]
MRHYYDELDEFEFDDNDIVSKIMREQEREERRLASKRNRRSSMKRRHAVPEPQDDFSDIESYDEFDDYEEYDDDEFDTYSGIDLDR